MISPEEHFQRREMIRKFKKELLAVRETSNQALKELVDPRFGFHGGGIGPDEHEEHRAYVEYVSAYERLTAQKSMTDAVWALVIRVFGKDAVDLAIEEGEQRIGSLPYIETSEPRDQ